MKSRISVYVSGLLLVGALVAGCGGTVAESEGQPLRERPLPATALVVTPGDGEVKVSWRFPAFSGGTPILRFNVQARDAQTGVVGGDEVAAGDATTATVTGLTNGVSYIVTVQAENAQGIRDSEPSEPVIPRKLLGVPRDIVATPGNQQVTLNWTPPEDTGLALSGYDVTVRSDGAEPVIHKTADTTLTVRELENGKAYTFTVQASNGDGPGVLSAPVTSTPRTVPGAFAFGLNPYDGRLVVHWGMPGSDGGSPITSYVVTLVNLTTRASTTYTVAPEAGVSTIEYEVTGLVNGTVYEATVSAINAAGATVSSPLQASPGRAPSAPRDFRAIVGEPSDGGFDLDVTWQPPEDLGGHAIERCRITVYDSLVAQPARVQTTATATSYSLGRWPAGPAGRTYRITLTCENTKGMSPEVEVVVER